jgi:2-dehydro-3-deoxyphosphogluconate aldolase/(4S)-4-hydroxy-2-oxoglutarate aldolase
MLKLFPADTVGPAYLKALRAPLDDVEFVPTGGIALDNLAAYVKAGAAAVGLGSQLVGKPGQEADELKKRAAALRAAWREAHGG